MVVELRRRTLLLLLSFALLARRCVGEIGEDSNRDFNEVSEACASVASLANSEGVSASPKEQWM